MSFYTKKTHSRKIDENTAFPSDLPCQHKLIMAFSVAAYLFMDPNIEVWRTMLIYELVDLWYNLWIPFPIIQKPLWRPICANEACIYCNATLDNHSHFGDNLYFTSNFIQVSFVMRDYSFYFKHFGKCVLTPQVICIMLTQTIFY